MSSESHIDPTAEKKKRQRRSAAAPRGFVSDPSELEESLREHVQRREGREALRKYLSPKDAEESIEFISAVLALRELRKEKAIVDACKTIYRSFVMPSGSRSVNIPASVSLPIEEAVKANLYDVHMFDGAVESILALLERLEWHLYLQSPEYAAFVDTIRRSSSPDKKKRDESKKRRSSSPTSDGDKKAVVSRAPSPQPPPVPTAVIMMDARRHSGDDKKARPRTEEMKEMKSFFRRSNSDRLRRAKAWQGDVEGEEEGSEASSTPRQVPILVLQREDGMAASFSDSASRKERKEKEKAERERRKEQRDRESKEQRKKELVAERKSGGSTSSSSTRTTQSGTPSSTELMRTISTSSSPPSSPTSTASTASAGSLPASYLRKTAPPASVKGTAIRTSAQ